MIIELLKILSSIFLTTVLVFGYGNHFKQDPILTIEDIPYTQLYDLEDFIEEYEEFKEEDNTTHESPRELLSLPPKLMFISLEVIYYCVRFFL